MERGHFWVQMDDWRGIHAWNVTYQYSYTFGVIDGYIMCPHIQEHPMTNLKRPFRINESIIKNL